MTPFWRATPGKDIPFTEDVRACLGAARDIAGRMGHEYVGAEHILLAIADSTERQATRALERIGVDISLLRSRLTAVIKQGNSPQSGPDLPYTSRAKRVLEQSAAEAHEQRESHVGSVQLLLGVLRERDNIAAQILTEFGVTTERVRGAAVATGDAPSV